MILRSLQELSPAVIPPEDRIRSQIFNWVLEPMKVGRRPHTWAELQRHLAPLGQRALNHPATLAARDYLCWGGRNGIEASLDKLQVEFAHRFTAALEQGRIRPVRRKAA